MATRKISINKGETQFAITEGVGSATTKTLEVTFDLAANYDRAALLDQLEMIEAYILGRPWPMA